MCNGKCWLTTVMLVVLLLCAVPAPVFAQGDGQMPGDGSAVATPANSSETAGTDTGAWIEMLATIPGQDWLRLALSTLTILVVAYVAGKIVYVVAHRLIRRTDSTLDDIVLQAIRPLIPWLLVAIGFQIATYHIGLSTDIGTQALEHVYFLLYLTVFFAAMWRLIHYLTAWYSTRIPDDRSEGMRPLIPLIQRIAQIALTLLTFLLFLEHFDIQFVAMATALGLGGLAVSLAAKDTLTDIISGVVIIVDRPFRVGDRIEIQGVDTWGDVVSIGLRTTHIRTPDNRTVIVPNSIIGNNLVVNHSYPDLRFRVQSEVGLPYGIDISEGRRIIEKAVRKEDSVIVDQPVEVLLRGFGDSALIVGVRWWIESYIDRQRSIDSVNAAIYRALGEANMHIPYPQRDVHHKIDPQDLIYMSRLMAEGQPMR